MRRVLAAALLLALAPLIDLSYTSIPRPETLRPIASLIASDVVVGAVPLGVAAALYLGGDGDGARKLLVAAGLLAAVGAALKAAVPAPRPYVSLGAAAPPPGEILTWIPELYRDEFASFPSLHSAAAFASAAALRKRRAVFGVALAGASLVAYTRVFLFAHYVVDVAAGAALGYVCVVLSGAALDRRG